MTTIIKSVSIRQYKENKTYYVLVASKYDEYGRVLGYGNLAYKYRKISQRLFDSLPREEAEPGKDLNGKVFSRHKLKEEFVQKRKPQLKSCPIIR